MVVSQKKYPAALIGYRKEAFKGLIPGNMRQADDAADKAPLRPSPPPKQPVSSVVSLSALEAA